MFIVLFFQITDDATSVFAAELPTDHLDQTSKNMYNHIGMLVKERDTYHDVSTNQNWLYVTPPPHPHFVAKNLVAMISLVSLLLIITYH